MEVMKSSREHRKKACAVILKTLKWIFGVFFVLIVIFMITRFIGQQINKRTPENGINEEMYVDINGTKQWISIYGQDIDNPVLLYIHGGPGAATSAYDYAFTRKWSDVYTIVTWDQRNCGKSYSEEQNNTELTYELLMNDGVEMTKEWAISDGIVPLASAKYPMKDSDKVKDYEDTVNAGEKLEKGIWYVRDPLGGQMHTGFMGSTGWPTSFEDFYVDFINMVNAN